MTDPQRLSWTTRIGNPFGSVPLCLWMLIASAGMFVAGTLSLGHLLKIPVPCGSSQGCVAVAMHPSSLVLGVPIAYLGLSAYAATLWLVNYADSRWARWTSLLLTCAGTAISGVLLYYSHYVIQAKCVWCIVSGVLMTVLCVVVAVVFATRRPLRKPHPLFVYAMALVAWAGLGLQAGQMEKVASTPPIPAEKLRDLSLDKVVDRSKSLGPDDAVVTIIMFGDIWCPGCRAIHRPLMEFQQKHPQSVRIVYRHLPLYQLRGHQTSGIGASVSEIAAEHGKFWEFVDIVNREQRLLMGDDYLKVLSQLGIDENVAKERLLNDTEDAAYLRVQADMQLAADLGITATPTFLLSIDHTPMISANQKLLVRILSSPEIGHLISRQESAIREGDAPPE